MTEGCTSPSFPLPTRWAPCPCFLPTARASSEGYISTALGCFRWCLWCGHGWRQIGFRSCDSVALPPPPVQNAAGRGDSYFLAFVGALPLYLSCSFGRAAVSLSVRRISFAANYHTVQCSIPNSRRQNTITTISHRKIVRETGDIALPVNKNAHAPSACRSGHLVRGGGSYTGSRGVVNRG